MPKPEFDPADAEDDIMMLEGAASAIELIADSHGPEDSVPAEALYFMSMQMKQLCRSLRNKLFEASPCDTDRSAECNETSEGDFDLAA